MNEEQHIACANLMEWIQELQETLKEFIIEKNVLSISCGVLHRMKVVVWRLTSKNGTMSDTTCQKTHTLVPASSCRGWNRERERESFDFTMCFMCYLGHATQRPYFGSTVLEIKEYNPSSPMKESFDYQSWSPKGNSLTIWQASPGSVLLPRNIRANKYKPSVDKVQLLEANPRYVRFTEGNESTVPMQDLSPIQNRYEKN